MIFNDEQWAVIKEAGPHFRTAKQEYIRNVPRYMTEQIINIYESATGKQILYKDLNCATCVLRIYQQVGKAYFADLEERNSVENKNEQINEQLNEQIKPKRGRKSKK